MTMDELDIKDVEVLEDKHEIIIDGKFLISSRLRKEKYPLEKIKILIKDWEGKIKQFKEKRKELKENIKNKRQFEKRLLEHAWTETMMNKKIMDTQIKNFEEAIKNWGEKVEECERNTISE